MIATDLAAAIDGRLVGDGAAEVPDLTHDSRAASPRCGFVAIRGQHHDGHRFVPDAVAAGAPVLIVEHEVPADVPVIVVDDCRAVAGPAAAAVHGRPSDDLDVVGITGTNGKTTAVHLLSSIMEAAGRPARALGTLTGARTTPEGTDLQRMLAEWRQEGVAVVAMEVSSHALELHRVDGTRFRVAVFTSFGRDHLDFHGTEEAYFAAKARLFEPRLSDRAVVNGDDPRGRLLADAATIPTEMFTAADASDVVLEPGRSRFRWRGQQVDLALTGRFNVVNALAAASAAAALGVPSDAIAQGLTAAPPVPGRFEPVVAGQPFAVLVDFAHTPDAVRTAVAAAREVAGDARIIAVVGAGGDRDPSKRAPMGREAAAADVVVVTSDNPRSEDPAAIAAAVAEGAGPAARVELDRRSAIALAIGEARRGDVVLLLGKGHETTQTIGDQELAFDDRQVAAEVIAEMHGDVAS